MRPSPMVIPLVLSLVMGCPSDWDPHSTNTAPMATLDGTPTAVTRGVQATFWGTVEDDQQTSAELILFWSFTDPSGEQIQLTRGEDCDEAPHDEATRTGRASCSVTVPASSTLQSMTVTLSATDGLREATAEPLDVSIGAGGVPTCTLTAPAPQTDDPCFAGIEILVDGTCSDAETSPEALLLRFVDTYNDASGRPISEEYWAGDDTQDTAGPLLVFEPGQDAARLYGYLAFPASEADHNLCLTAEDVTGNGGEACISFFVNPPNTPPWCEILLPVAGTTGPLGQPLLLEAEVGDDQQDMAGVEVAWYADQAGPLPFGTSFVEEGGAVHLTEQDAFATSGDYVITLAVEDMWAEQATCSVDYTVGEGPSVQIDSPLTGDWLDDDELIPFTGTFADRQDACEDLTLEWVSSLDGTLWGPDVPASRDCTDTFLYDPTTLGPLSEGGHVVYLYVTDGDGFTNADVVTIEVGDCARAWYLDLDADGYGSTAYNDVDGDGIDDAMAWDCTPPPGYADLSGDCDDWDAATFPGAPESCNGLDDDCDGVVDEGFHLVDFYRDADGDGYGDATAGYDADGDGTPDRACSSATISGYATLSGDCDDSLPSINPGEAELCDDIDHDCDGSVDNGFTYPYGTTLYLDADGDGYGAASTTSCGVMTGWVLDGGDCDDADINVHPGATEVCDVTPVDNDCDGDADPPGVAGCVDQYLDDDGDGYGTSLGTSACVCASNPGSYGATNTGDCDDSAFAINPAADEVCDPDDTDEDCDGYVETEGALGCAWFFFDGDGDDYYAAGAASRCLCAAEGSYAGNIAGDCDDTDGAINPAALEVCDAANTDEDCDGLSDDDDGSASGQSTWYRDSDSDGYGWAGVTLARCEQPTGYLTDDTDCDDTIATIHPGGFEICDAANADEDCDGVADDDDPSATGQTSWYLDDDADGYGVTTSSVIFCDEPAGYATSDTDCDDTNASIHPGAMETTGDGVDYDCDGAELCYDDDDDDGYLDTTGDTRTSTDLDCDDAYEGSDSTVTTDCDDSNAAIHPGATETVGDGIDYNCDGSEICYDDDDNDGYLSTAGDTRTSSDTDCSDAYEGTTSDPTTDCNDNNSAIHPGATETVGDGIDYNCDGRETCYHDDDNDGYLDTLGDTTSSSDTDCNDAYEGKTTDPTTDCNDYNSAIHPGATETVGDGVDYNCDGTEICYHDDDNDGYLDTLGDTTTSSDTDCNDAYEGSTSTPTTDCYDYDDDYYPGATDTVTPMTISGSNGLSVWNSSYGDREFAGNGPYVYCNVTYTIVSDGFSRYIYCRWRETTSDWSTGTMSYSYSYSPGPSTCRPASIRTSGRTLTSGSHTQTISYTDTGHGLDSGGPWTSWIQSISLYGDTSGNDLDCDSGGWSSGSNPCSRVVSMVSNPVTITY